jgi:SAM-dependent methyltransferase
MPASQQVYSGIDNLEVMQEAVNYNRYLLELVRRHASLDQHILDFGAGTGQFALPLHEQRFKITAVEPDPSMRRDIASRGLAVAGSASELAHAAFHLVYSINVLEHIDDDVGALRQLHRALVNGGTLLIYVPAFPALYTAMDAKVGHVRRYTRASLHEAVNAAGFCIDRSDYVDSLGFIATLLFKLCGSGRGDLNRTALKLFDRFVFPVSLRVDGVTKRWFGKNLLLRAHK